MSKIHERVCEVISIAVSALYKDAFHKIRHKQDQLSESLAKVDCPKEPVQVVKVLKDLADMDLNCCQEHTNDNWQP